MFYKKMDEKTKKEIQKDMEKYKDTMDENEKKIFNEEFNINQSKFSMEIKKFNEEKLEDSFLFVSIKLFSNLLKLFLFLNFFSLSFLTSKSKFNIPSYSLPPLHQLHPIIKKI